MTLVFEKSCGLPRPEKRFPEWIRFAKEAQNLQVFAMKEYFEEYTNKKFEKPIYWSSRILFFNMCGLLTSYADLDKNKNRAGLNIFAAWLLVFYRELYFFHCNQFSWWKSQFSEQDN